MTRNLEEFPVRQLFWDSSDQEWEDSQIVIRDLLAEDMLEGEPPEEGSVRVLFLPPIESFKGADYISEQMSQAFEIDPDFWTLYVTNGYFQGKVNAFQAEYQTSHDSTITHMTRFVIQDRSEEGTEDKYHQHNLTFFSIWLSENNRTAFSQILLCFGLNEDMQSSVVKEFKEFDGLVLSGGAFEVYGAMARTISDYAAQATRRLENAICDIEQISIDFYYSMNCLKLTPYLKDRPIVNALPEDPKRRYRLLLDKYEEMRELSRKVIQARESLTVAEKIVSGINKYDETHKEHWAPDTQTDTPERIKYIKQFGKMIHKIDKRAGSYKRRLDHEIKLVHQLISAEKAADSRQSVIQSALWEENYRLRQYIFVLFCLGAIVFLLGGVVLQKKFEQLKYGQ